ncbi:MAG: D-alanine--D-alanine ligase [Candidatus Paceibacterota bacterium]
MSEARVAVLRGGPSDEYEVSMRTGASVLGALQKSSYQPHDIVISKAGEWIVDGFPRAPKDALATADVAFIALHGAYGEDGEVQRLLDRLGIPYTGSKAYASSLAMNKILTKEHLYDMPVKMAPHMRVTKGRNTDIARVAHRIEELYGHECVVKPVNSGSSVDTFITRGGGELTRILGQLLEHRDEVLVEKRIHGREATIGVVERFRDQSLYALPAIEIVVPDEEHFFTYNAKYSGKTDEICPGRFSADEKRQLSDFAAQIHAILGLSQYSRSDFIVADDGMYFLEVNTLPGLTAESLMPKALDAVGCSYSEFIEHLITDALVRRR